MIKLVMTSRERERDEKERGERGGSRMAKAKRNRGRRIVKRKLKRSDRRDSTMKRNRR